MRGRSSSRASNPESVMEDESVTTDDENKRTTVCNDSDDDESEDKWFVPNGKMAEYAKSDEGGTDETRGEEDMQSSDKWSRRPSEEGCDIGSTESVAEYAKSDERGTNEARGQEDMQSSDKRSRRLREGGCDIGSTESVAEYAKSDERGTDEARGQEDMQSSDKRSRWPREGGCDIGSTESVAEYTKSDEGGTDEARGQEDIQSSDKWSRRSSGEDCDFGSTESVFQSQNIQSQMKEEQMKLEITRTCSHHMQSSSDKYSPPSVEDYPIGNIQLDDVDTTFAQICQRFENSDAILGDLLTSFGPQKTVECIKQQLNRWETEKVRFAVAGRSATGKPTFINTFRGIKKVKMASLMLDLVTKRRKFQNINTH